MLSYLDQKTYRRSFKFFKYALLTGRPIVIISSSFFSRRNFLKKLIKSGGHCLTDSFYYAKTVNAGQKSQGLKSTVIPRPAAYLILETFSSKKAFQSFLFSAKTQQIPVIDLSKKPFLLSDYYFSSQTHKKKEFSVFLIWLIYQIFKASSKN